MNSRLRKSVLITLTLSGIAGVGGALLCWNYGIWSWEDWEAYQGMDAECHPVWRELQGGRIKPGDKIERVLWRTHPNRVEDFENVKILTYGGGFTAVAVIAKDGHVVSGGAGSCTWRKTFFDDWERSDQDAFWTRYSAHMHERWKAQNGQQ